MSSNFRVKLNILTPFYLSHTLTLDGLLAAAIYNKMGLLGADAIPYIPLDSVSGIFKASSLAFEKRYRLMSFGRIMSLRGENDLSVNVFAPNRRGGKGYVFVDKKRGQYKSNLQTYPGIFSREVFFWGVGDPDKVSHLIKNFILGIGKRCNAGAGEIADVEVTVIDEDLSWITKEGKPARPLPAEVWSSLEIEGRKEWPVIPHAVTVPYWSGNLCSAVVPEILTN
ncbi:hypothetical protein [Undibacterium sp.]|uniref:hypothetical protein n=1 Tax=Undibacterium sp. TaxID=1914977 RepID=UPI0037504D99